MSFTVTATQSGSSSNQGTYLLVKVLTGATEAGGASNGGNNTSAGSTTGTLTPNSANSLPVWAISADGTTFASSPAANNTIYANQADATDFWEAFFGFYSGAVASGTPITYGVANPGGDHENWCGYEIQPSGGTTPAVDGSSPAIAGANTGTSATTAAFTPPAGSVLAAMVVAGGTGAGTGITVTMTDTSGLGLTWTRRAISSTSDNFQPTYVFTATIAGLPAGQVPAQAVRSRYYPARRQQQPPAPPPAGSSAALTDSGTGSDALTAAAAAPLPDTGTGADALAAAVSVPLADSGSGSDVLGVSVAAALTDSGAGADALAAAAQAGLADSGAAADALTVSAAAPLTDAGAGTDALSVSAAAALSDAGAGTDMLAVAQPVALADSGTGTDVLSATAQTALSDSGTGSDAVAAAAAVQLADAGTGTDALIAGSGTSPALADAGTGTDALSVAVQAALPEAGTGADALTTVSGILKTDTDSCTASESGFAFISSSETGTAADGAEVIRVRDTDRCAMTERELTRWPHDTDRCTAAERGWQSGPVQGGTDTCTASDGRELIRLASADMCEAADTAPDIEVYTYVPPFRTGPGGGWYKVAWGDTEVLRVPRADGAVLRFAAALARAREVRVVADADCCTAAEASRPVTGVAISVVPALEVAIAVSSDIPAFR